MFTPTCAIKKCLKKCLKTYVLLTQKPVETPWQHAIPSLSVIHKTAAVLENRTQLPERCSRRRKRVRIPRQPKQERAKEGGRSPVLLWAKQRGVRDLVRLSTQLGQHCQRLWWV